MKTTATDKEAQFIAAHLNDDAENLLLHAEKYSNEDIDLRFCAHQIAMRRRLGSKLPTLCGNLRVVFAPKLNMEQTSSEAAARYKASLLAEDARVCDLTSGFGVDAYFFSQRASRLVAVEKQDWLSELCQSNFEALGVKNCEFVSADCEDYLGRMESVDAIYLDPSRRDASQGRVYAVRDCKPDVEKLQGELLSKAPHVLIKLSPMAELKALERSFSSLCDIHVLSLQNECKEVLLELRRDYSGEVRRHAVLLQPKEDQAPRVFSFSEESERQFPPTYGQVGKYLYEPDVALLKTCGFGKLCREFKVWKLAAGTHLYSSQEPICDFAGRAFEVVKQRSASAKALKDIPKANIAVRNFPQSVQTLRKQTKIREGGEVYLFFATLNTGEKVCIECRKLSK